MLNGFTSLPVTHARAYTAAHAGEPAPLCAHPSALPAALSPARPPAPALAHAPVLPGTAPATPHKPPTAPDLLIRMLDEIDYGLLLVDAQGLVLHLNHPARAELGSGHPLQMAGALLRCPAPSDAAALAAALQGAQRGLRRLLLLGDGPDRISISVVPLAPGGGGHHAVDDPILLLLGKRQVCAELSIRSYARSVHLTPAEERVLAALCEGARPAEIAQALSVRLSTVRTQVCSIRAKAGASSIGAVVRQVSLLPPLAGVLRLQGA